MNKQNAEKVMVAAMTLEQIDYLIKHLTVSKRRFVAVRINGEAANLSRTSVLKAARAERVLKANDRRMR